MVAWKGAVALCDPPVAGHRDLQIGFRLPCAEAPVAGLKSPIGPLDELRGLIPFDV